MRNAARIIIYMTLALMIVSFFISIVTADSDLPPMPPDDSQPSGDGSSGGGGGGGDSVGGGSSYVPQAFQPYIEPLKSSDGRTVGTLDVQDYSKVLVSASNNTTLGNVTYSLSIRSELDSKPVDAVMDFELGYNNSSSLPAGLTDAIHLYSVKVTRSGKFGWGLKSGTVVMTWTLPATVLPGNGSQYYLVRYDQTGYQIMPALMTFNNDSVTFTASPTSEEGVFTLVLAGLPTPTPVPISETTEQKIHTAPEQIEATPMPAAPGGVPFGYAGWAVMFIGGATIGGVAAFFIGRKFG